MVTDTLTRVRVSVERGLVERRMIIRPCACGGAIRADRYAPTAYVAAHNRSKQHREWWTRVSCDWQGTP